MITIKEVLKKYFADNMFVKISRAISLEKDMKQLAKQDPRFEFLNFLLKRKTKGAFLFPEYIVNMCDSIQIKTLDDLYKWLDAIHVPEIMPIIDPKLKFNLKEKKSIKDIKDIITSQVSLESNCVWNFGDSHYNFIDKDELKLILSECPINHRKYIEDNFDCEDFAQTTKCWLKIHEVENIAFGFCEVNFYKDGKITFAHGLNIVPLRDGSVVCVEPQNDHIWLANKPEFSFHMDEMKFRFIQI